MNERKCFAILGKIERKFIQLLLTFFQFFPVLQNIFVFSQSGFVCKGVNSTIIEFLCIALLEVKITEVKDCLICPAAFSLALISMSKSSSVLEISDESTSVPDKSLGSSCCNNFKRSQVYCKYWIATI